MMTRKISMFVVGLWLCSFTVALSQNANTFQSYFTNGKELLELGKNALAMQAFKTVINAENPYKETASYLYGVAAFREKQYYVARDMFLQVAATSSNWKQIDEVNLWLTNLYLIDGDYNKAMGYASSINDPVIAQNAIGLKQQFLAKKDYEELIGMLDEHPSDAQVASAVCDAIIQKPFNEQDRELLENLVSVFEFDKTKYRIDDQLKTIKKDRYHIAVMLPFMLEDLKTNPRRVSNEFVLELYEGMVLGINELKKQGIDVRLHLYDTRRDSSYTAKLTQLEELKHMDLIIGPLYPGPVKVMSDYSFKHRINMLNPLSGNSEIVTNNPFAFLYMPSEEMTARKLAEFAAKNITNKNLMIFYTKSPKDSAVAMTYKAEIESKGYKVNYMEGIPKENSKKLLSLLTNTKTIEIDAAELDQPVKQSNLQGNLRIAEMSYLTIKPDSIGHIFIASDDPSLVANALTGLATRGDSVQIVGTEKWLDHRILSLEGLGRQRAILAAPAIVDTTNPRYESLTTSCKETFNAYPTKNFFIGYELMITTGRLLKRHGTLFQFDPSYRQPITGDLSGGVFYGEEHCNQIVPMAQFSANGIQLKNYK